jgi:16S rRNA (guanine966-N2)-methyltransferase
MRVVAGTAGGRRLKSPSGSRLRPTSERVREAVFASLGSLGAVESARVLDLFAGTGALGIEALSRGAAAATFVDSDREAVETIRSNLEATGLTGTVVRSDALRFLQETSETFDLALVDPPYAFEEWPTLLAALPARLAVLESGAEVEALPGWAILRARRYGDSVVTLARRQEGFPCRSP